MPLEFYVKMVIAIVGAGIVFHFMEKAQKRKEEKARRQFELTMKSYGLSTEIIEPKGDSNGNDPEKR